MKDVVQVQLTAEEVLILSTSLVTLALRHPGIGGAPTPAQLQPALERLNTETIVKLGRRLSTIGLHLSMQEDDV